MKLVYKLVPILKTLPAKEFNSNKKNLKWQIFFFFLIDIHLLKGARDT